MAPAPTANKVFAFLVPRGDLDVLPDVVVPAPRALPVNGRTLVVPHDHDPAALFARELDVIVGPATGRGPFARVALHSVGSVDLRSGASISWVRTTPFPARQALRGEPWDDKAPITIHLQRLLVAVERGGEDEFWASALRSKLCAQEVVGPDERAAWATAAADELAATLTPVVIQTEAPRSPDDVTGRWGWWPPSFW